MHSSAYNRNPIGSYEVLARTATICRREIVKTLSICDLDNLGMLFRELVADERMKWCLLHFNTSKVYL